MISKYDNPSFNGMKLPNIKSAQMENARRFYDKNKKTAEKMANININFTSKKKEKKL